MPEFILPRPALACAAALCLALGACGQRGPLYLPTVPPPVSQPDASQASQPADTPAAASPSSVSKPSN